MYLLKVAQIFLVIMLIFFFSTVNAESSCGFLSQETIPDSLLLLSPPPLESTPGFVSDKDNYFLARKLRNTPRDKAAISDGDLNDISIAKSFSAAFGIEISPNTTPLTFAILKNVHIDAGKLATRSAKNYYKRTRPFVYFKDTSCRPQDEKVLAENGSYPSGHAAVGWAIALILVEINPNQQQEILKKGYQFGQSRVICGAHWQSDVEAGRIMGAATVARLHADTNFCKEMLFAKIEIARLRQAACQKV